MFSHYLTRGFCAALLVSLAGCETTRPIPRGNALSTGRKIYLTKCTACHSAEPIARHSVADWNEIIPEMAHKARLTETERSELTAYVMAAHSANP